MSAPLLKVLFMEDNDDDGLIVKLKLEELAMVKVCATWQEFQESLRKEDWDAILVDYKLPGITGENAIRMARKEKQDVPVIVVTGSVDDETASVACQSGAVDYLRKDRLYRLPMAVQSAVANAQLNRENEERKLHEMRNQRLEMLGELVVGLCHDIRNTLSVIIAGVEMIRPKIASAETRILDVMASSVKRTEQMLVQILTFGRGDSGELHKVSTEYVVGEIASLLHAGTFPANIRVQVTTAIGTAQIRCDESQLNRALWNLCVNAREVMMPDGGSLIISAQNVQLQEGLFVCISIRDTGKGIPEDIQAKLFEPFFSTKGKHGTGLGLAMTKQIISAHGGKIEVASDSSGTEFSVFIPVAVESKNNTAAPFDGQGRTILLVEDEEFLRAWGKLRLEHANYRVLEAANGPAAMSLYLAHLDEVVALVTDLNMPVMQGNQLAKLFLELKPALPIIYITGLSVEERYEPVPSAILEKPYSSVKLLETLKSILD